MGQHKIKKTLEISTIPRIIRIVLVQVVPLFLRRPVRVMLRRLKQIPPRRARTVCDPMTLINHSRGSGKTYGAIHGDIVAKED
jgi:hypothetical protein